MDIDAGQLDEKITLQVAIRSIDPTSGETLLSYRPFTTIWGLVRPLTSNESYKAKQVQLETTHKVVIHHREITSDMRIRRRDGSILEIKGYQRSFDKQWTFIDCVSIEES